MDFSAELKEMNAWIASNCGHQGVGTGWRQVDAKIDSPWYTVEYLGHMNNAFSICESRCSLIAAAFTGGSDSVLTKAKGAMTGFGDMSQVDSTTAGINALLGVVGKGPESGPSEALKSIMEACYGKGSDEYNTTVSSLNAAAKIISDAMGTQSGYTGSKYKWDLDSIAHQGDTYMGGAWINLNLGTINDVGPQVAEVQSLHSAITTIANLFTGASQSMGELQKSMQTSQNSVFGLLDKWMQGLYNVNKNSISQETR